MHPSSRPLHRKHAALKAQWYNVICCPCTTPCLAVSPVHLQVGGKLAKEMKGALFDIFARILRGLSGARITRPGAFKNALGDGVAVRCSYKADDGLLYPLDKAFFYVHKPPLLIPYEDVEVRPVASRGACMHACVCAAAFTSTAAVLACSAWPRVALPGRPPAPLSWSALPAALLLSAKPAPCMHSRLCTGLHVCLTPPWPAVCPSLGSL